MKRVMKLHHTIQIKLDDLRTTLRKAGYTDIPEEGECVLTFGPDPETRVNSTVFSVHKPVEGKPGKTEAVYFFFTVQEVKDALAVKAPVQEVVDALNSGTFESFNINQGNLEGGGAPCANIFVTTTIAK